MKQIGKLMLLGVVFGILLVSQGCKKDSGPGETVEDIQLRKLSKTWNATSVKLDNLDQTDYDNFALTISGTAGSPTFGYSVTGRPTTLSPWLSSGQWKFGASPETQIVRDPDTGDELNMTYSVTDTQLQITFTFTGDGYPGRISNVKGQWVFTFQ
ncbi:MAG TPA: hypothetical protein PKN99_10545 [Cyclobacteriaceae bacterium]|jgi:hypothetical protein|nr:hypothetical protein [Cyclobacteriaceae bacterium]HRK54524.1 hypothetical protein [Cyclobacteriaceae bacterium]